MKAILVLLGAAMLTAACTVSAKIHGVRVDGSSPKPAVITRD